MQDPLSECRSWPSVADLFGRKEEAPLAFLGAPLGEKSQTPGRCDLGPKAVREALRRFSQYDVETGVDLAGLDVFDAGDAFLKTLTPSEAFSPLHEAARAALAGRRLLILAGGNNAVTRPLVHAAGDLASTGLVTFDAHFDLRDTDCGLTNGNPVRALIEDGLPGDNIVQIGLAPFANTRRAHDFAREQGITVRTLRDCREVGVERLAAEALDRLAARCARIVVDFDIDVIDRAECPGAPGARPGGISALSFFGAARLVGAHPKVVAVDLSEFDPSLDVADTTQLIAGRWVCEVLAGFHRRG